MPFKRNKAYKNNPIFFQQAGKREVNDCLTFAIFNNTKHGHAQ